jgi:hypothetical protein
MMFDNGMDGPPRPKEFVFSKTFVCDWDIWLERMWRKYVVEDKICGEPDMGISGAVDPAVDDQSRTESDHSG